MIKPEQLQCWKCGASLEYLLLPLSRTARCKICDAALHACRMCRFFDTHVARSCHEPVAMEVKEKERANFCDYLELAAGTYIPKDTGAANASQSELNSLFGLNSGADNSDMDNSTSLSATDKSKQKLDELFGLDKKK